MAGAAPGCATQAFLLDQCCAPPQSTGARSLEPCPGVFSLLLPPSVLLVTPVGPHPVFAFLFCLCSACVVCLGSLLPYFSFPLLPALLCRLPWPLPRPLRCPPPPCHFLFSSVPHGLISFQSSPPLLHPPTLSHRKRERERKEGDQPLPPKKPKQKLILSVFRSAASSWWPMCPCGLQPARPPYPSAVCPARLPALLFPPTTRSSVPGCLVMVSDV